MAYLITGGTGLIGSRVVRDLVKNQEQVIVYDMYPAADVFKDLLTENEIARIKLIRGDVTDFPFLLRTVKENKVNIIIHMAYLLGEATSANPPLGIKVNCGGTVNVFEIARQMKIDRVVWASSLTVFGPPDKYPQEYVPNDAPHYPIGLYGATKAFNENVALHYFQEYHTDIIGIRYSGVYGFGQARGIFGGIMRELISNPVAGKPGKVPFGDDEIGWLYVDDAANATLMACKVPTTRTRTFTIDGELRSIKEAVAYVKQLMPQADIAVEPGLWGITQKFDISPLKQEIGYKPEWPMERGLKAIINNTRRQQGLPELP